MEATELATIDVEPAERVVGGTDSPLDLDSPSQVKTAAFSLYFSLMPSVAFSRIKGHGKLQILQ